ncbi:MAG: hypothetical protein DMF68_16825 [Acidobacteria bacterium]|nr:MAG: hypothetical protein DMF68_16825 [Acidobacteriota bacterium]
MKRCPTCQQTFPDDAPNFCPNEGTPLVSDSQQQQYYQGGQQPYPGGQQPPYYGAPGNPPPPQQGGWTPPPPQGYGYPPQGQYPPYGYAPPVGRGTGLSKAALFTGIGSIGSLALAVILVRVAISSYSYGLLQMGGLLVWLALFAAIAAVTLGVITIVNASKNPAINKIHGIIGACLGGLTLLIWLIGLARMRRF